MVGAGGGHRETEAEAVAGVRGLAGGQQIAGHQGHGGGAQHPRPVQFAAVGHHQAEAQVVLHRHHQATAAGKEGDADELRVFAGAVLHNEAAVLAHDVVGAEPFHHLRRHVEVGVVHAEGTEQAVLHEAVERGAAHALHQMPQHVGRKAVVPALAGLEQERYVRHLLNQLAGVAHEVIPIVDQPRLAVEPIDDGVAVVAVAQARGVHQQLPRRDGRRDGRHLAGGGQRRHALPLGKELGHGRIQQQLAVLDEHQRRDAGDGFRHRVDAQERIGRQFRAGFQVQQPGHMLEHHRAAPRDEGGHAGKLAALHQAIHFRAHPVQTFRGHAVGFRQGPWHFRPLGAPCRQAQCQRGAGESAANPRPAWRRCAVIASGRSRCHVRFPSATLKA